MAVHCVDDIPIQCLGHSVAFVFSISNARKYQHMADYGFLCGCHLYVGHRLGETSHHVFVRWILGARQRSDAEKLHAKIEVQGESVCNWRHVNEYSILSLPVVGYSVVDSIGFAVPHTWHEGGVFAGTASTQNSNFLGIVSFIGSRDCVAVSGNSRLFCVRRPTNKNCFLSLNPIRCVSVVRCATCCT